MFFLPSHHGPLSGRRILLTHPKPLFKECLAQEKAPAPPTAGTDELKGPHTLACPPDAWVEAFLQAGATVEHLPLIRIKRLALEAHSQSCLAEIGKYGWIVITSSNGAGCFLEALPSYAYPLLQGPGPRPQVACVGPSSAQLLLQKGITVDLMASEFHAIALGNEILQQPNWQLKPILLIQGTRNNPQLAQKLQSCGAQIECLILYDTQLEESLLQASAQTDLRPPDVACFTSPSAVLAFTAQCPPAWRAQHAPAYASIGPSTSAQLKASGLKVSIQAHPHSRTGLLQGLLDYFGA